MNKALIKKYILLFFVISLPLVAAVLIGNYGYRSEKFGQGVWYDKYKQNFFVFEEDFTTREKIHRAMKYGLNSHYKLYDDEPFFSETIKNEQGEDLFMLEIYRAIFQAQDQDKVEYLYTFYNVQYFKLRDAFDVDSGVRQQIDKANVPEISVNIYKISEEGKVIREPDREIGMLTFSDIRTVIPDYDADVDFQQGYSGDKRKDTDELVYCPLGFHRIVDTEWSESDKVLVEVSASINEVRDENNQPIQTKVAEVEVDNYYSDSEKIDYQNYKASYMQNLKNSDYFKWLFKHYLWWISLIAFVIVGFITFSFYIAWLAETASTIKTKKVKK